MLTTALELAAAVCLAAAAWLQFGPVGLLVCLAVLFVLAAWLIESAQGGDGE